VGSPALAETKLPGVGGLGAREWRKPTIFFALRLAERKLRNDMLLRLERGPRQNKRAFGGNQDDDAKEETDDVGEYNGSDDV
jgi:hypothetical protein